MLQAPYLEKVKQNRNHAWQIQSVLVWHYDRHIMNSTSFPLSIIAILFLVKPISNAYVSKSILISNTNLYYSASLQVDLVVCFASWCLDFEHLPSSATYVSVKTWQAEKNNDINQSSAVSSKQKRGRLFPKTSYKSVWLIHQIDLC